MHWNHRVMVHEDGLYGIHEVYYESEGTAVGWTYGAISPGGETLEELQAEYEQMASAFDKPVLDSKTGKEIGPTEEVYNYDCPCCMARAADAAASAKAFDAEYARLRKSYSRMSETHNEPG